MVAFGAGVLLGLACATKWSGLYYVAFFGLMSLAMDVAARRAPTGCGGLGGVLRRDVGPAYVFGVIPPALYLLSYWAWFASETAVNRYEVGQSIGSGGGGSPGRAAVAVALHLQGVPLPFHADQLRGQSPSLGVQALDVADVAAAGAVRDRQPGCVPGCGAASCVKSVLLVGTPPCGSWRSWCCSTRPGALVRRDWRYAVVLVGYLAGWLPWLANIDRQMYFFYAVPLAPFLMMAIALILGDILLPADLGNPERRTLGCWWSVSISRRRSRISRGCSPC